MCYVLRVMFDVGIITCMTRRLTCALLKHISTLFCYTRLTDIFVTDWENDASSDGSNDDGDDDDDDDGEDDNDE